MALPTSQNGVSARKLASTLNGLWTKIKGAFAPKNDGQTTHDVTKFYRADGTWAVPSGDACKIVYIDATVNTSSTLTNWVVTCDGVTYDTVAGYINNDNLIPVIRLTESGGNRKWILPCQGLFKTSEYDYYRFVSSEVMETDYGYVVEIKLNNTSTAYQRWYIKQKWLETYDNKTSDITGNSTSTSKYPSCKGVYDFNKVLLFEAPYSNGANTYPDKDTVKAAIEDGKHPVIRVYGSSSGNHVDYRFESLVTGGGSWQMNFISEYHRLYYYSSPNSWLISEEVAPLDSTGKVPTTKLPTATTSASGITRLTSTVDSSTETKAVTPKGVYDFVIPKSYSINASSRYYKIATVNGISGDPSYAGCILAVVVRDGNSADVQCLISISFSEYGTTANTEPVIGKVFKIAGRYPGVGTIKFFVNRVTSDKYEIYAYTTNSYNYISTNVLTGYGITIHSSANALSEIPSGGTVTELTRVKSIFTTSNYQVGSNSQPVYVDSNGQVQPCNLSQLKAALASA